MALTLYHMAAPGFTSEQIEEVARLAGLGLTQDQIAEWFGFSDDTLRRRLQSDPEAMRAYKQGKIQAVDRVARTLYQKALEGDNACMIFYLKTQAHWREVERKEISGPDGGPIQTVQAGDATEYIRGELARLATLSDTKADPGNGRRSRVGREA